MSTYQTLKGKSTSLFKEKGSKFYAYAFPIQNKEEVKNLLLEIQEEHPKARHICTALLLGQGNKEYYLTNDDGEPSNSAGAPILGQIRSHDITNVFIAVVRYFGGVKLGVGGLIQAYKQAAHDAIENNEIIELEPQSTIKLYLDYSQMGNILSIIDRNNLKVDIGDKENQSIITIHCDTKDLDRIIALFERSKVKIEKL